MSGSENWETYDDASDPEPEVDASDAYYAKLRAARVRRFTPEPTTATTTMVHGQSSMNTSTATNIHYHGSGGGAMQPAKKIKGIRSPNPHASTKTMVQGEGGRMIVVSGSDAGWTDEDHF